MRCSSADEAERGDEPEAGGERASEGASGVPAVDERMDVRRVFEVARERLGEEGDRRAHVHGPRPDEQRRAAVEGEAEPARVPREMGETARAASKSHGNTSA